MTDSHSVCSSRPSDSPSPRPACPSSTSVPAAKSPTVVTRHPTPDRLHEPWSTSQPSQPTSHRPSFLINDILGRASHTTPCTPSTPISHGTTHPALPQGGGARPSMYHHQTAGGHHSRNSESSRSRGRFQNTDEGVPHIQHPPSSLQPRDIAPWLMIPRLSEESLNPTTSGAERLVKYNSDCDLDLDDDMDDDDSTAASNGRRIYTLLQMVRKGLYFTPNRRHRPIL